MQQEQILQNAISEGVSKGVPMDFISYSLRRAGWPDKLVASAIDQWLHENGRSYTTTEFKPWLKTYYQKARWEIIIMVSLDIVGSAIALLKPWPVKLLADSVFGGIKAPGVLAPMTGKPSLILVVAALTLGLFVVGSAFGTLRDWLMLKIAFRLNQSIKEESFRHILHLPLYHEGRLTKGDYIYRQNEVTSSLSDLILTTTSQIIEALVLVVGVCIIMLKLNFMLTLITLIVIPFLIVSVRFFSPIMGKFGRAMMELQSKISTLITESIDNAETIQAFTLQERQVNRLKDYWQENYRVSNGGMLWGQAFDFTNGFFVILGTSAVIYFGGSMALNGQFSLGQLLIFMTYMGYLIGPIQDVTEQITVRRQKMVNVHRVYEVLTDHEGIESVHADAHLPRVTGRIDLQGVSYATSEGTPILNQVNLTIMPGEKIGIVGPSGAGKSTLMKLVDLYLDPSMGRILLDGYDIQTVSLQDLRRNIAWVSQSPQLLAGTIRDNMLDSDLNRPISEQEIAWAAQAANLNEFVDKLPLGLDSPVEENGSNLSGGQRQRISIARALLKNAPIICLDEPTSALDMKSEKLIQGSIGTLIEGKTVLLVTHRVPLLSLMDKILVLDQGQLVDVNNYGGLNEYMTYQMQQEGRLVADESSGEPLVPQAGMQIAPQSAAEAAPPVA